jgi:hypothetical protein
MKGFVKTNATISFTNSAYIARSTLYSNGPDLANSAYIARTIF